MKKKKIIAQKVVVDDLVFEGDQNYCQLVTQFEDGSILSEPITAAEAAEYQARLGRL